MGDLGIVGDEWLDLRGNEWRCRLVKAMLCRVGRGEGGGGVGIVCVTSRSLCKSNTKLEPREDIVGPSFARVVSEAVES